jgi:hypothetical protein
VHQVWLSPSRSVPVSAGLLIQCRNGTASVGDMTTGKRSVLMTGGTGDLGRQTAQRIAATDAGWHVVITGRDAKPAEDAATRITERTGAPVTGLPLELASLDNVRRFTADFLRQDLPPLHAIVCNAGRQIRGVGSRTVTVNAFDPGLMPGTGLARDYRGFPGFAWRYLLPALIAVPGVNAHTVGHSASALARLIADPALGSVTAQYFSGTKPRRSSADSYDRAKAADLWAVSSELAGLA